MTGARAFFDTNILLHMFSCADAVKRDTATQLFYSHARFNHAVLSTQVVQEF